MPRFLLGSVLTLTLTAGVLAACGNHDACAPPCLEAAAGGTPGTGGTHGEGGSGPVQITADKWGLITLGSFAFDASKYLRATFSDIPVTLHPDCQLHSTAACDLRICPTTQSEVTERAPSAGLIQVTSSDVVGQALIQPDPTGLYPEGQIGFGDGVFFFAGGESLTFIAAGAEVPAFDVQTHYPNALRVVDPPGVEGLVTLDPAVGATLMLSGGAADDEIRLFGRETTEGIETTMVCTFPSQPGTVPLGPELLGLLPQGFPLTVVRMHRTQLQAGEYDVTIRVLGDVADFADAAAVSIVVQSSPGPTP